MPQTETTRETSSDPEPSSEVRRDMMVKTLMASRGFSPSCRFVALPGAGTAGKLARSASGQTDPQAQGDFCKVLR